MLFGCIVFFFVFVMQSQLRLTLKWRKMRVSMRYSLHLTQEKRRNKPKTKKETTFNAKLKHKNQHLKWRWKLKRKMKKMKKTEERQGTNENYSIVDWQSFWEIGKEKAKTQPKIRLIVWNMSHKPSFQDASSIRYAPKWRKNVKSQARTCYISIKIEWKSKVHLDRKFGILAHVGCGFFFFFFGTLRVSVFQAT